jgi:hypothetical protein
MIEPEVLRFTADAAGAMTFVYLIVRTATQVLFYFLPSSAERSQDKLVDDVVNQLRDMTTMYEKLVNRFMDRLEGTPRS